MALGISVENEERTIEGSIVLKIDFDPSSSSAARVFEIAAEFIHSLEGMDRVLGSSIYTGLSTSLIVEDLQKSSVKIWLKNVFEDMPDDALKDASVKKLLGHYLLKSKYAIIEWLDDEENQNLPVTDLTEKVAQLARETDLRRLPDYPAPEPSELAVPMDRFQQAKKRFKQSEGLTITLGADEYHVNTNSSWLPSEVIEPEPDDQELINEQELFLVIGKPDFIGSSRWFFQHGKNKFHLKIHDEDWLERFHNGQFPLKPGDALRVLLRIESKYDARGNLVEANKSITKVFEVIADASSLGDLFDD